MDPMTFLLGGATGAALTALVARTREHRASPAGLADLLNWAFLVDDGVVLQKDGALLAALRYRGPDLSSATLAELDALHAQLNDALFHAGLNSGSQYEWKDEANRLHFYVVDLKRDPQGILSYTVAVRSMDSAGGQQRGVTVSERQSGSGSVVRVRVTNTGGAVDLFRLSASSEGQGSPATLGNALVALQPGQSADVPVYLAGATGNAVVTFMATSESDKTKAARLLIPRGDGPEPPVR